MNLGQPIVHASVSQKDPQLCLVSFPSIAPSLIDFREERSQTLPCLQMGELVPLPCHCQVPIQYQGHKFCAWRRHCEVISSNSRYGPLYWLL